MQPLTKWQTIYPFDMFQEIELFMDKVRGGEESPLDAYIELKALADYVQDCLNEIKDQAITEGEKFKGQTYKGFQIDVRSVGGKYSYDHIAEWVELKEKIKEVEKFHQAAYKNRNQGFFLNEHTGEIYEPAAYKEGPTTLIFKAI